MKAFETDREASSTKKAYSTMYITVLVQRQSGWFISNVFLLIGLLLAYDWFTFLISPVRYTHQRFKTYLIVIYTTTLPNTNICSI